MKDKIIICACILGLSVLVGLAALGYLPGSAALKFKSFERTVTVKGLSEKVYPASVVIWPIVFTEAGNDLNALYTTLESKTDLIKNFLISNGFKVDEISIPSPAINDKSNSWYGRDQKPEFRYSATQKMSVYTDNIALARQLMSDIRALGKQGIAFARDYQAMPRYEFTKLNDVKPEMIEEATKKAREVALKFAQDSNSRLGKIKRAAQGNFSISDRDEINQHLKVIRVVSTVEYYLSD